MTLNQDLGLLLFGVLFYVVVTQIVSAAYTHELRERLICERNRNRFGELRTAMMAMVAEDKIDPRSPFFAPMYGALTALMRNPGAHEAAAQHVLTMMPPKEGKPNYKPTELERDILREFSLRLDLLCRDHSRTYAFCAWLVDKIPLDAAHRAPFWMMVVRERMKKKTSLVYQARERLDNLCSA